jgi:hypothetical protein
MNSTDESTDPLGQKVPPDDPAVDLEAKSNGEQAIADEISPEPAQGASSRSRDPDSDIDGERQPDPDGPLGLASTAGVSIFDREPKTFQHAATEHQLDTDEGRVSVAPDVLSAEKPGEQEDHQDGAPSGEDGDRIGQATEGVDRQHQGSITGMPGGMVRKQVNEKASEFLDQQVKAAVASLRLNLAMNTWARFGFYLAAITFLALLIWVIYVRFDQMFVVKEGASLSANLAASLPLLILLLCTGVCVGLAILIQNRNGSEFSKALDQVSRLRREGSAATSRSLALTQILEETLANARQAFSMQLWISRVLFMLGVGLILSFIVSLFGNNPWVSGGSVVTSILAFGASALLNPQRQISADLANVTQLEAILGGYVRQASMLEEHIYQIMETSQDAGTPGSAHQFVKEGVSQLTGILQNAVKSIDNQIHSTSRVSDREAWLWRQVTETQELQTKSGSSS